MGSSRTGLDLEDTSRTKFCGLGLGLDHVVLEHIPGLQVCNHACIQALG